MIRSRLDGGARRAVLVGAAWATVACGDNAATFDPPDAGPAPVADAIAIDAGADAIPDAPDAAPDAAPIVAVIDTVAVEDQPDRELHQGADAVLVVRGTGLGDARAARLRPAGGTGGVDSDGFELPFAERSHDELRLTVEVPHGQPPGPLALVLTTSAGVIVVDGAVVVTPIVVAPTAQRGGRGTYASPALLCDIDDRDRFSLDRGDIVHATAGVHDCRKSVYLRRGVIVRGDGRTRTTLRRYDINFSFGFFGTSEVSDLSFENPDSVAIRVWDGDLVVRRVGATMPDGIGIDMSSHGVATIDDFRFTATTDWGIGVITGYYGGAPTVTARDVSIKGGYSCLTVLSGSVSVTGARLECAREGARVGSTQYRLLTSPRLDLDDTVIAGAELRIEQGDVTVTSSTVGGSDGDELFQGIMLYSGSLAVRASTIHHVETGLHAYGFGQSSRDGALDVSLDDVTIDASHDGLYFLPTAAPSALTVRRSRISSARSNAIDIAGSAARLDLGTAASPGDNRLTSTGGFALSDRHGDAEVVTDAHGTTLNGTEYSGEISGPAEVGRDYRLTSATRVRF